VYGEGEIVVPIHVARKVKSSSIRTTILTSILATMPVRAGYCAGLTALLLVIGCNSLQNATAEGDTRTITLHHMHTEEDLTITFKVNGRYDEEALKKIGVSSTWSGRCIATSALPSRSR
jgi:hypothetical protein